MTRFTSLLAATLFTALPLALAAPGNAVTRETADGSIKVARGGGDIDIPVTRGSAELATGGGKIHVAGAGGNVRASTGGGDVTIDSAGGNVDVATGNGAVTVTLKGSHDVSIASGHGQVELRVPASLSATFDVETSYGKDHPPVKVRSDFPLTITESATFEVRNGNSPRKYVKGEGKAGSGGARVKIRTVNADIRIVKG